MTRQVSVCVTTYNQKDYIRQCLESVLAQSGDLVQEILVGDDCSDDGTSEIIAEFAASHRELVRHVRHASRLGASANTRSLLRQTQAPLIARLDGDDYWMPEKLLRQSAYFAAHPECVAVYTNAIAISESGTPLGMFNDVGDASFGVAELLRRGNFLNNSSAMFRRTHIGDWLRIDEPILDYRVHLMLATQGLLAQLGEPLTVYRVKSRGSLVSSANDHVRQLYWEAILSVPRHMVDATDVVAAMADFLSRVSIRAVRTRRWQLLADWVPRVLAASPCGGGRMAVAVLMAIIRSTWAESKGRLLRPRTLYPRRARDICGRT